MKTSDLTGATLDYWAAKATEAWGWAHEIYPTMTLDPTFSGIRMGVWPRGEYGALIPTAILSPNNPMRQDAMPFCPSTVWEHGGPIIERMRLTIDYNHNDDAWEAYISGEGMNDDYERGTTPLIAAMRAVVASVYGADVPDN